MAKKKRRMNEEQRSAFDEMRSMLQEHGLGMFTPILRDLILDGNTDPAQINLALQETNEWKQRFAGNEQLKAAGLPVLSVAEYLATERSYAQVMKNYGLPEGFYDDPSDFAGFIGNSVAPSEVQSRVQAYADIAKREDPAIISQLQSMGLGEGDILAHLMDPERAWPMLERKYKQVTLGAAARRQGLTAGRKYLGHLADLGVTEQQAQQGYGLISEQLPAMGRLGAIYGEDFGQRDLESEVFEQDGDAARKRKRLASRERAQFGGSAGTGRGSLGRSTGGSY